MRVITIEGADLRPRTDTRGIITAPRLVAKREARPRTHNTRRGWYTAEPLAARRRPPVASRGIRNGAPATAPVGAWGKGGAQ